MSGTVTPTRAVQYELEIEIQGSRETIWKALTEEIEQWWLPDFHILGEGSVLTFDAVPGGQLVEKTTDGGGLVWYTVQMCTPGESLYLVGSVAPDWGGPATTMLKLLIDERADGCVLKVSDAIFGHVSDENIDSLSDGWRQLFGEGLKKYVER